MADVFISYTHIDNEALTLSAEQHGWIDLFHEALEKRLKQIWKRGATIWRDPQNAGNDVLESFIEAEVRASAMLLTIVSPDYMRSEWCIKELRMFCEAAAQSGGLQIGNKSRIIKVIKTPVDADPDVAAPAELAPGTGYKFFKMTERGHPVEIDPRHGAQEHAAFVSAVVDLAYGVRDMLRILEQRPGDAPAALTTGSVVYLAETSYDLQDVRDAARRELEQFGHTVLPDAELRYDEAYAAQVAEQLARARLSIHLVGANYGMIPEGESRSIVELQYALARDLAHERPGFATFAWLQPGTAPKGEAQARFVAALHDGAQLLNIPFEGLRQQVAEALQRPLADTSGTVAESQPAAARSADAGRRTVYVLYDAADATAAGAFVDDLSRRGFDVDTPLFDGEERELREDLEENLRSCDAVLIYHGEATEFWLRTKLRDLQRAFGLGRRRPFLATAVVFGEPRRAKQAVRRAGVLTLEAYGAFDPAALEPFVAQVRRAGDTAL